MLWLSVALAADTWSDPAPGVRHLHRTMSGPFDIYAAQIDLCERGVTVRATKESERQDQTSDFGERVGAQLAVNGDFFSYDDYYPTGLAVADGAARNTDNSWESGLTFGRSHAWIAPDDDDWSTPDWWMDDVVSGYPLLVVDGEVPTSFNRSDCEDRHPRTAAGLTTDRRTLLLVAVDGRSSASLGMNCEELGELLDDLGAYTAVNLDGGGSTTLWFEAYGVVNNPSDGSERTVSNHLAVLADGSGAPEACDFWLYEPIHNPSVLDDGGTDVDGDGTADICARSSVGLECHTASGKWTLPEMANDQGFDVQSTFASIRFGDIDGNGLADVCARRPEGLACWPSTGTGFGTRQDIPALTDDDGANVVRYYSTVRLADVDADGRDDVCARGPDGITCWPSTGTGFAAGVAGPPLSDERGWDEPYYFGTIRLADFDGDGREDLCARGGATVYCYRSDPTGWIAVDGPDWSNDAGWDDVQHWSTIRFADIDGDGLADLVGRGPDGMEWARSDGAGFAAPTLVLSLADVSGWNDHDNYATIRLGDLDADGDLDLCARASAGIYCWLWEGAAWTTRIDGPAHSDTLGWNDWRYYLSLQMGDVDADGRADLCDRAAAGFECHVYDGTVFTTVSGPEWSDDLGWDDPMYGTTMRVAGGGPIASADTGETGTEGTGDTSTDSGEPAAAVVKSDPGCGCGGGAAFVVVGLAALRRRAGSRRRFCSREARPGPQSPERASQA